MSTYWETKLPEHLSIQQHETGLSVYEPRPKHVADLLWETVKRVPEQTALVFENKQMTYAELGEKVKRVAYHLQNKYKVKKGERVALLLGNGLYYPICFFAIAHIGALSVPLNVRLSPDEIKYELIKSQYRILIAENEYWDSISSHFQNINQLDKIIVTKKINNGEKLFSELTRPCDKEPVMPEILETEPCSIFFTSGTTGHPKGALLTHLGFVAVTFQLHAKDSTLMMVPMFHITGMLQFLGAIYTGIPIYMIRSYQTEQVLELIERHQPSILVGVPTMYWFMLSSKQFKKETFANVRALLYGGAPDRKSVV